MGADERDEAGGRAGLVDRVLAEAVDDWIPVDMLLWHAREEAKRSGEDFRQVAVALLEVLLEEHLMELGDLGESGFEAWNSPVGDQVRRFVDGCESVGWEPFGALWWLAITPEGLRRVG
ncbi:hypothetical protein ACLIYP_30355 [Streptomyces nanhaiensis]|uniref:hypothetical protein n=1 Tax=Streptomyces nanhaiensis TaxID=679319 RepID=UPI00399D2583